MTAIDQHANPEVSSGKRWITDHPSLGNLAREQTPGVGETNRLKQTPS